MFLLCLTTFHQLTVAIRTKPKALNMVYKALRGLLSQSASCLHLMLHFSISCCTSPSLCSANWTSLRSLIIVRFFLPQYFHKLFPLPSGLVPNSSGLLKHFLRENFPDPTGQVGPLRPLRGHGPCLFYSQL